MTEDVMTLAGVMMTLLATATVGYAAFILVNALGRKLGHRQPSGISEEDFEALRGQGLELDEMRGRMEELEERVDFAERLLAQQTEAGRLSAGNEQG